MPHHALVLGASGLAGWAVVDQLLRNYPSAGTFSKITAVSNRPLKLSETQWPGTGDMKGFENMPELELVDGVDMSKGEVSEFTASLKKKVDLSGVTVMFYYAFKQHDEDEVRVNRGMLERAVGAVNELCPKLEFVVWPSGSRRYGLYLPGGWYKAPLLESMDPLPEEHRKQIFYFAFRDVLEEASKGRSWTWAEICPDAIIGFSPNGSAFNLTAHWANYLSLYAAVEGAGAKVPFPGSVKGYNSLSNSASSAIVARASIWAALHPDVTSRQFFNIADSATPTSMAQTWPKLAAHFGLVGVGPVSDLKLEGGLGFGGEAAKDIVGGPSEYVSKHRDVLEKKGVKGAGEMVWQGRALDGYGWFLDFDRYVGLDKIRNAGFKEEREPEKAWEETFERFRKAGLILKE